ncbi:MAG TPA: ROK family transcriptional regulator [Paludibacter sp.]|jgi:glucokinase-like ROK family protein|nr:MAG: N-acetylglucosamine repressor [Bacteroidetes bacterium ADurb.Bin174]HQB27706.1 ROK family transcriptional regulator [Paludibacter sp.]
MTFKFIQEINSGYKNAYLKREIICCYINNGECTLADLGREMGLSVPTVTKLVAELMDDGFVLELGKQETSGGRRPSIYGLNANSGYFVGVDMRQFHINIGVINFKGKLVDSQMNIPFQMDHTHESFDNLCNIISDFLEKTTVPRELILSIGINISGRVNTESGHSYSFFYFDERPLTEVFKERFGINVTIDNDSRSMAYGEYMKGCVSGEKNVLFVNVSWGLGAGIIINGKLYYGKSGFSGEFGHMTAFENEVICHCGKKGCLETEASGSYIYKKFLEKIAEGYSSSLTKKIEKNKSIVLEDIIHAALNEDILAIELIEDVGNTLGKHIAGLINLLNPELVVIGGTVANAGDYLMLPLKSAMKKYSLNLVSKDTALKLSKLGDKVGLIGACMLARSKILGLIP